MIVAPNYEGDICLYLYDKVYSITGLNCIPTVCAVARYHAKNEKFIFYYVQGKEIYICTLVLEETAEVDDEPSLYYTTSFEPVGLTHYNGRLVAYDDEYIQCKDFIVKSDKGKYVQGIIELGEESAFVTYDGLIPELLPNKNLILNLNNLLEFIDGKIFSLTSKVWLPSESSRVLNFTQIKVHNKMHNIIPYCSSYKVLKLYSKNLTSITAYSNYATFTTEYDTNLYATSYSYETYTSAEHIVIPLSKKVKSARN